VCVSVCVLCELLLLAVSAEEAERGPSTAAADVAVLLRRVHAGLHRALIVIRHTVGGHPEHLLRLTALTTAAQTYVSSDKGSCV